jgi:hypothetical protein
MPFYAQVELRKQSVDSGGAVAQSGSIKMLFTVGEVAVAEATSGTYSVSEGFIGKDINLALGIVGFEELAGVNIYPNPVVDILHITLPDLHLYSIELFDMTGKCLLQIQSNGTLNNEINLQEYEQTAYLLLIKDTENKKVKIFKLLTR